MVKVRDEQPILEDGSVDITAWMQRIDQIKTAADKTAIETAVKLAQAHDMGKETAMHASCFHQGLWMAEILDDLNADIPTLSAAIVYSIHRYGELPLSTIEEGLGHTVSSLILGLDKMNLIKDNNVLQMKPDGSSFENLFKLRKMLLAVVEDIRVVLIKLAEHLCDLRAAVALDKDLRLTLAYEAKEIFAPLANRLGIGQIKWEIEDFAFRYLEPFTYKHIAKLLDEKRIDRERYIQEVIQSLKGSLQIQGIEAEIYGRVKHIYSIWRKMKRKMVGYDQIYDVRAIRVIVPRITDCYATLGVVHTLWQHIPKEFDDYIANAKSNGYQSLHTAVVGPHGKILEIQIRTETMHLQSELGVAAHWRYKEGAKHEPNYEKKLKQLRQFVNWHSELANDTEAAEALKQELDEDRVYVFTPQGDVLDLPQGATGLDFAYHIHTELGHKTRGVKINGQMVPLTRVLKSGDQIEVLTTKEGGPSRDWLNSHLKYLTTARARSKVHSWFKKQDRDENIQEGRDILSKEFKRLGLGHIELKAIVNELSNCQTEEDLLAGIGAGDIRVAQVLQAVFRIQKEHVKEKRDEFLTPIKAARKLEPTEISVQGIGGLLCHVAKCCHPVPGEEIIGYITVGEGVSVHRKDCLNILQLKESHKNRLIEVAWGEESHNHYATTIMVRAYQRRDLLKDITSILASEMVDIQDMRMLNEKKDLEITIELTIQVNGIEMLSQVLQKIQQLPNIIEAYRKVR